jgi:hypothetical protein
MNGWRASGTLQAFAGNRQIEVLLAQHVVIANSAAIGLVSIRAQAICYHPHGNKADWQHLGPAKIRRDL